MSRALLCFSEAMAQLGSAQEIDLGSRNHISAMPCSSPKAFLYGSKYRFEFGEVCGGFLGCPSMIALLFEVDGTNRKIIMSCEARDVEILKAKLQEMVDFCRASCA